MLIPVNVAAVTYRLAPGDVIPSASAVTVVPPRAMPVAAPVAIFIDAIAGSSTPHFTLALISAVVVSEYVPMAVKFVVNPFATAALFGFIEIAVNTGSVTVKITLLEARPLADAVIVVLPCFRAVT